MTSLFTYLSDLTCSPNQCLIVGDFNFPDICWSSLTGSSVLSNSFCEFIFDCNLTQHVMEPTHVKGNILDLVLSSDRVNVDGLNIFRSVFIHSDHFIVSFSCHCDIFPSVSCKSSYVFDFSKADLTVFVLSVCFESNDIEFIWCKIKSFIFEAMSLYVPKVRKRSHQGPKWFDSGIRHHLKCLRTLHWKYNSHPTPLILSKLKSSEHQLQLKMVSLKSDYEAKLITLRTRLKTGTKFSVFSEKHQKH